MKMRIVTAAALAAGLLLTGCGGSSSSKGSSASTTTAATTSGWLPFLVYPERMDRVWGEAVSAGLARRDDALGEFDVVAGGLVAIGDDARPAFDPLATARRRR